MSDIAIKIENLGKRYRYGGPAAVSYNLRQDLTDWAKGLLRRPDRRQKTTDHSPQFAAHDSGVSSDSASVSGLPGTASRGRGSQSAPESPVSSLQSPVSSLQSELSHRTLHEIHEDHLAHDPNYFWALRDINLEVRHGEVVGIIGRNGAGKSTLLKILSRITPPTTGKITYNGRIASLLEVGTGFHRELTGRENIFLNGSILGMKRAEIAKKFDEIVAFAEVEKFIDTPVKFYSSGMYVRLAFAVAAHLEPEILVVDEVLAVGDASFQKKCLGKMGDVAKQGRTILFVSHNMIAINSLCRRAVLLDGGHIVHDGAVEPVVAAYLSAGIQQGGSREWPEPQNAPGTDDLRVKRIQIIANSGTGDGILNMQTPVQVDTDYWVLQSDVQLHITYHLINDQGIVVLTTGSGAARRPTGCYHSNFVVPANLLNSGGYSLNLLIVKNENQVVFRKETIASFTIVDTAERNLAWMGREPSVIRPILPWQTEPVAPIA